MRRSLRDKRQVNHYGEIESFREGSEEDYGEGYNFMPQRILPTRSCNLRSQSVAEYTTASLSSKLSREKREVLKQLDIKFRFESYEELRTTLLSIIEQLKENEAAWPFLEPVPQEVPYYHTIITDPIDLSTISDRVESFTYPSEKEFFDDLNLMFENCRTFNEPGTDISKAGVTLKKLVFKLKAADFPDFEDVDSEKIIVDRTTREPPKLNSSGHVIVDKVLIPKPEVVVKQEVEAKDLNFAIELIFPKYRVEPDLSSVHLIQSSTNFNEVALFFSLLARTEAYELPGNKNFSLAALERSFIVPHQSSLFLSLHFLLFAKVNEVKRMKKLFTIIPGDIQGFSDVVDTKINSSEFNFGSFVKRLHEKLLLWNKTRNILKRDYFLISTGDLDVGFGKLEQIEIELDFYNELLFPLTNNKTEDYQEFSDTPIIQVVPFKDINSFIELTPAQRILLTQAIISWRLIGYQDLNIYTALRSLEPQSLNQSSISTDLKGDKYFYFEEFFQETRIYKLSPCFDQKFYSFYNLLTKLESRKEILNLELSFETLKAKKYLEAEDKVIDLREVKTKLRRKLQKRTHSAYLTTLCKEFLEFLKQIEEEAKSKEMEKKNDNLYPCVYSKLKDILKEAPKKDTFIGIPEEMRKVEISDSDESEDDEMEEEEEEDEVDEKASVDSEDDSRKRKRSISKDSTEEVKEEDEKEEPSADVEEEENLNDIVFDGNSYHPIRRSSRARKTVKRLQVDFDNDRVKRSSRKRRKKSSRLSKFDSSNSGSKSKKKRKKNKSKMKSNNKTPGELVKSEVTEIESLLELLRNDAFESYLVLNRQENLLSKYVSLKENLKSKVMLNNPVKWELCCSTPEELEILIEELRNNSLRKKYNKSLVTKLTTILEDLSVRTEVQQQIEVKEEKKIMKEIEIQNAPRKRSSRIQHEQEKVSEIRQDQEFERMKVVRRDCAEALWNMYIKKRRKLLDQERRFLQTEYEKGLALERQRELELKQQKEAEFRQREVERMQEAMRAQQRKMMEIRQQKEQMSLARERQRESIRQQKIAISTNNYIHQQQQPQQAAYNYQNQNGLTQSQQAPRVAQASYEMPVYAQQHQPLSQYNQAAYNVANHQFTQAQDPRFTQAQAQQHNLQQYQNSQINPAYYQQMLTEQQRAYLANNPNVLQNYQNLQNYNKQNGNQNNSDWPNSSRKNNNGPFY